jgi:hypothetical protein
VFSFLTIQHIIERSDDRGILARIYIDDYCVWLQTARDDAIAALTHELTRVADVSKRGLFECCDLHQIEQYAADNANEDAR